MPIGEINAIKREAFLGVLAEEREAGHLNRHLISRIEHEIIEKLG